MPWAETEPRVGMGTKPQRDVVSARHLRQPVGRERGGSGPWAPRRGILPCD